MGKWTDLELGSPRKYIHICLFTDTAAYAQWLWYAAPVVWAHAWHPLPTSQESCELRQQIHPRSVQSEVCSPVCIYFQSPKD